MELNSYVSGRWQKGNDAGVALVDPTLGAEIARASTSGIDFGAALGFAREVGGAELRRMGYGSRAAMLTALADTLAANRDDYYAIAQANSGSPKSDAAIDIEGAIFTMKYFAKLGRSLGDANHFLDGGLSQLGKDEAFQAQHILVPVRGVAVLINAFNFPAWGMWEKAAPALLSGVPVFVKPATSTAWLAQRMIEDIVAAGVAPEGAISIICGSAGDLLDHLTVDDLVSFTGSAATAARIRTHDNVVRSSIRVNVEADSLNIALLAPDATAGTDEFDLLVKEAAREMTVKAGQKCTAIRRILVPKRSADDFSDALAARLAKVVVGNPRNPDIRMGPLVNRDQLAVAREGLAMLASEATVVCGNAESFEPVDAEIESGAFLPPTLLRCDAPLEARYVHKVEIFGPTATLMPYYDLSQAYEIARLGKGSLTASVWSGDASLLAAAALELADSHGRVMAVSADVGTSHTGHGNVMPMCLHGGPGRAGGGEELGGLRALGFYHRRSAIQGPLDALENLRTGIETFTV